MIPVRETNHGPRAPRHNRDNPANPTATPLYAQRGTFPPEDAEALAGYLGRSVIEIKQRLRGEAYRAVYTVQFEDAVIVLYAWHKKSRRGRETESEIRALIPQRLQAAAAVYARWKREREQSEV